MGRPGLIARLAVLGMILGGTARAEHHSVSFPEAMARVRSHAAAALVARARIGEAEARRDFAGRLLGVNPQIEALGGPRTGQGMDSTDVEVNVTQMLEFGQRGARTRGAEAQLESARHGAEEAVRRAQLATGVRFYQALYARERAAFLAEAARTAVSLAEATDKRVRRGDSTDLDRHRARTAAGLARADQLSAEARYRSELLALGTLLGLEPNDTLELEGSLSAARVPALAALKKQAETRPDLMTLRALQKEAEALVSLGTAQRFPQFGLRFSFGREQNQTVVRGGALLTLPLFDRGQEHRGEGSARARRIGIEGVAETRAIARELDGGQARYQTLLEAVETFEKETLSHIDEGERLLMKSYDGGLLDVGDYLVARREFLQARADYLEHLLELAVAAVELRLTAGAMP